MIAVVILDSSEHFWMPQKIGKTGIGNPILHGFLAKREKFPNFEFPIVLFLAKHRNCQFIIPISGSCLEELTKIGNWKSVQMWAGAKNRHTRHLKSQLSFQKKFLISCGRFLMF